MESPRLCREVGARYVMYTTRHTTVCAVGLHTEYYDRGGPFRT